MLLEKSMRIVPWVSMEEWTQVYQQIYSDNIEEKRIGLNQMTVWKSRVQKLSLGVECSLYLLQAILRDEEYKKEPENALTHHDVVLLYSTAIIRFVNLISHLGQVDLKHQPISAIAEMAGIPDWVVSIRHEATHAKMPSLEVLRPGSKLAMQWLQVNYWRTEEENSYDLYWPEHRNVLPSRMSEAKRRKIQAKKEVAKRAYPTLAPVSEEYEEIPEELQVAVSMLVEILKEMTVRNSLNQIVTAKDLHQYSVELWMQHKAPPKQLSRKEILRLHEPLDKIRRLLLLEVKRILKEWVETDNEGNNGDTPDKETVEANKGRCLISALCQCPSLLRTPPKNTLFNVLMPFWRLAQRWKVVPYLMKSVATIKVANENDRVAHLQLFTELTAAVLHARRNPKDNTNLFKFDEALRTADWRSMVDALLYEPHPETWNAVSPLFHMLDPPLDKKRREEIATLLQICSDDKASDNFAEVMIHSKTYTVDHLLPAEDESSTNEKEKDEVKGKTEEGSYSSDSNCTIDEWTLSTEYDWSRIPLGSLPGNKLVNLELKVDWKEIEPTDQGSHLDRDFKLLKRKRFDWNSLEHKRRKRGGQTKMSLNAFVKSQ